MRKKADELVFTHDPWTRDASGIHDSLKSYHHARKKKLHLPRNEKIQSWCESTGKWELRSRKQSRNELREGVGPSTVHLACMH